MKCKKVKKVTMAMALLLILLCLPGETNAVYTYDFQGITNNNHGDVAAGESQLFVEVTDPGSNQVLFTFRNIGAEYMVISDVYFDDGTLFGIPSVDNSDPGVSFSKGASPGNLPGGGAIGFVTTVDFLADADPPVNKNGVSPGEQLGILFNLIGGQVFNDTIVALNNGQDLRIGLHVQGFDSGGSESFVNNTSLIPAPGAILLGSIGVGIVGWLRRRQAL